MRLELWKLLQIKLDRKDSPLHLLLGMVNQSITHTHTHTRARARTHTQFKNDLEILSGEVMEISN